MEWKLINISDIEDNQSDDDDERENNDLTV